MTDDLKNILINPYGVEVYTIWDTANEGGECSHHFQSETANEIKEFYDDRQEFDGEEWTYQESIPLFKYRITEGRDFYHEEVIDQDEWIPDFEFERSDYEEHNNLFKASRGV